jgi:hypothetical protein
MGKMEKIKPIDPKVQQASDDFRNALSKLKEAQDPLVKEVLRHEALEKLHQFAAVKEASKIMSDLQRLPFSAN